VRAPERQLPAVGSGDFWFVGAGADVVVEYGFVERDVAVDVWVSVVSL
jgi:hypothetical protein